ncbi:HNH endonuclease signature motif containing protein [Millisia brevis]|uniref:HNH endonuclease signature motif containing protein n=1 Tax=Millisia brevis TaxID=264148 RepID=UPI000830BA8F|nr:HNH endonuclease signature motif containing protein [Millisia brevis]
MSNATASADGSLSGSERVLEQLEMDRRLGAPELISMLTHCASVVASAHFRLLQAAAILHEDFALTYGERIAAAVGDEPVESPAALRAGSVDTSNARATFGPDGMEQAMAAVGAALSVPPARARELVVAGCTMRYHLPLTGKMLARGRIDLARFLLIVHRTALCDETAFPEVDAALAEEIHSRAPMSLTRFRTLVDATVARIDAIAARRRLEQVGAARHISVRPDRHTPGQSRITGSLPAHHAAGVDARLTTMAQSVHPTDPRTAAQRRADALVALVNGEQELGCACPTCGEPVGTDEASATMGALDADSSSPGESAALADRPIPADTSRPRPTFHIIVSLATLLGANDCPAYLDGHGVLDAGVARDLVREATRSYVHTAERQSDADSTSGGASITDRRSRSYTPSRSLRGLVSAGELCCTFPGCTTAVHACDLDHTTAYGAGGLTRRTNLKPLCRFHHRLKTFDIGWRDYQDPLGTVAFRAPTGHYFIGNAYTGYDVFTELRPTIPDAAHPARTRLSRARRGRVADHARALDRWDRAHPPPF